MPVQIGQKPESDFTQPLGLLSDCHRRIERFLNVLVRVSESRKDGNLTDDEKSAFENALAYFRNSAPKHTADEEESLFPRLRSAGAHRVLECLEKLEGDHQAASRDHATVDALCTIWIAAGSLSPEQHHELGQALNRLRALYTAHIAIEDQELFPLAAQVLPEQELAEVGQEMAARRGFRK
jgi:hemerythrin-like domain-containing protein